MTEIKFRAWDKKNKKMLFIEGWTLLEITANYGEFKNLELKWLQFTGLKDKNEKEAYHKDKVSALGYEWIIEWHNNGWKLKQEDVENYQEIPKDFIIFSNIYEGEK